MKIRIKAAVVLNARETQVIANILSINADNVKATVKPSQSQREEEIRVVREFLDMHTELKMRMAN